MKPYKKEIVENGKPISAIVRFELEYFSEIEKGKFYITSSMWYCSYKDADKAIFKDKMGCEIYITPENFSRIKIIYKP